ncbi:hypothetical protein [Pleionea litopenaei]|uniref:Uncharacterized protein n=1 Tax=Pleionea litopenaei TaxID=3070815 RepID=A0AA51X704_9GAMM|nr:hypothetical protein [Pleionea sp. HL-JVS1]WMS87386.1 hypothetical protein Q9312_00300 [Pleionea sp. HL-JVS1]
MKYINTSVLAIVTALFLTGAQAGWEDYKEKTLAATIEEHKEMVGTVDFNYVPRYPMLVFARVTEEARNTPESQLRVIRGWLKSIGQKEEIAELYLQQIKVEEKGEFYWLAVQKPLIPYIDSELKNGDFVWLYVAWVGNYKSDWVFLINEFEKAEFNQ